MSYLRWSAAEDMDTLNDDERNNAILNRWENIFEGSINNFDRGYQNLGHLMNGQKVHGHLLLHLKMKL